MGARCCVHQETADIVDVYTEQGSSLLNFEHAPVAAAAKLPSATQEMSKAVRFSEKKVSVRDNIPLVVEKSQLELEMEMDHLLSEIECMTSSFAVQYRQYRASAAPRPSSESFTSTDEALHKVLLTLRRLDRLNKNQKQSGEEGRFVDMYLGGPKKRLRSLPDIVRKVTAEIRIARLLKGWGRTGRTSFIKGSFEADAAELRIDIWDGVDVFEVEKVFQSPLTMVFYAIWQASNLPLVFKARKHQVLDYLKAVESGYTATEANSYHNRMHAAEVTLMSYQLYCGLSALPTWENYFAEVDVMVLIFSSAIHDIGHPGVNNDYMVKTKSDLALRYHDTAVLENFHLATAFELMRVKGVSLLEHQLPSPPVNSLRRRIVDIVLATDMAVHQTHIDKLSAEIQKAETDQDIDKRILEQYLVHMADIGHALRPREQHLEWTNRVNTEFFNQGDREKELGLTPIALFDRDKAPPLGKGQTGFLKFVVEPLWSPLGSILRHEADLANRCLQENIKAWQALAADEEEAAEAKKKTSNETHDERSESKSIIFSLKKSFTPAKLAKMGSSKDTAGSPRRTKTKDWRKPWTLLPR